MTDDDRPLGAVLTRREALALLGVGGLTALAAGVLLHLGTNILNEIYDVRHGIDTITSPRASHALLKGRLTEAEAFRIVFGAYVLSALFGITLIAARGWPVAAIGLVGLVGGFGYSAPPLQYKYKALGIPLVFVLMGPLMVMGSYFVFTGSLAWQPLLVSIPIGLLVVAILHGNEWRDITEDTRTAGSATFASRFGPREATCLVATAEVAAVRIPVMKRPSISAPGTPVE